MSHTEPSRSPSQTVGAYLAAVEARDLDLAREFLAQGFQMTFPGDAVFSTIEELVAWGKDRYRFVTKTYERFDEVESSDGVIVYCYGTLAGEYPDGTPFNEVRFIDRFVVADGKLCDQKVWNDLGEHSRCKSRRQTGPGNRSNPLTPTSKIR